MFYKIPSEEFILGKKEKGGNGCKHCIYFYIICMLSLCLIFTMSFLPFCEHYVTCSVRDLKSYLYVGNECLYLRRKYFYMCT